MSTALMESGLARRYPAETEALLSIGHKSVVRTANVSADQWKPFLRLAEAELIPEGPRTRLSWSEEIKEVDSNSEQRLSTPIIPLSHMGSGRPTVESQVIHSDQMHADALYLSLIGFMTGEVELPAEIRDNVIERASALLFANASIAHFIAQSNLTGTYPESPHYSQGQTYIDAGKIEQYVLTGESFHRALAEGGVPTVDVHDLVHHAIQFRSWPEFFAPFYKIFYHLDQVIGTDSNEGIPLDQYRLKKALSLISFATAEYSVVGTNLDNVSSYGCLLYQYPRKSPAKGVNLRDGDMTPREFTMWNALRAMMSMKRRVIEVSRGLREDLCWFEELGYRLPYQYSPVIGKWGELVSEPIADLSRTHVVDGSKIKLPADAKELMRNAAKLALKEIQRSPIADHKEIAPWMDELTLLVK